MRSHFYVTGTMSIGLLIATGLPSWSQGMAEAGALQGLPGLGSGLGQGLGRGYGTVGGLGGGGRTQVTGGGYAPRIDEETARAYGERANAYYGQARAAQKKGKTAQSEKLYKQSLKLREAVWGSQDPAVPTILVVVSELEQKQGKLADAEQSAKRAVAMMTRMYGASSPYVKPAERQLAKVAAARRTFHK